MQMTLEQSHYVLQVLIARRQVRAAQVARALRDRQREIQELKQRLASLEALGAPVGRPARRARKAPARRRRLSPKVRALRRRQGQYMGFVRRLKPADKARVRTVREKQGIVPAIRLAASLGRK
jgi:hypothetical protein